MAIPLILVGNQRYWGRGSSIPGRAKPGLLVNWCETRDLTAEYTSIGTDIINAITAIHRSSRMDTSNFTPDY